MNQGLKSYTKQFTHDVSGVGTLSFNLDWACKNMHMVLPLIKTPGPSPIELYLIYSEQDRDVDGQFGKGFRLNLFKKISEISGGYEVQNADGSVDKYLSSDNYYNKETGLTYEPQDWDGEHKIKDTKGNSVYWDSASSCYPRTITNTNQSKLEFGLLNGNVIYITNDHNDVIAIEKSNDKIYLVFKHNPYATPLASTVLSLTDSRVTEIQYNQYKEGIVGNEYNS